MKEKINWVLLCELIEKIEFGTITVEVRKGRPFKVHRVVKEIALFDERKYKDL